MAILLIPAPQLSNRRVEPYLPYGLCSLQAIAAGRGWPLDVLDFGLFSQECGFTSSEEFARAVAASVDVTRYSIIGLSTMCSSFHHSLNIARLLHERDPAVRLWMGGPHASVHPERLLAAYPWIEAVFVGEGEGPFSSALSCSAGDGLHLDGIPGVCTRGTRFVPARPLDDPDGLPFVDDTPAYRAAEAWCASPDEPPALPVEVERGCPGRCTFCSTRRFWGGRTRRKSDERVMLEMRRLRERTGIADFSLVGDNVAFPRASLLAFCAAMAREMPDCHWYSSLKLDQLTVGDLDALWNGGCNGFFVGLESASQSTLDRIRKDIDLARQLPVVRAAIDRGFRVSISLIVGFPWETKEERHATYRLHEELLRRGAWRSSVMAICAHPGTDFTRQYGRNAVPWRGFSASAVDFMPYGDQTRALMRSCPELFTQFAHVNSESTDLEISATLRAASMIAFHYMGQTHFGVSGEHRRSSSPPGA